MFPPRTPNGQPCVYEQYAHAYMHLPPKTSPPSTQRRLLLGGAVAFGLGLGGCSPPLAPLRVGAIAFAGYGFLFLAQDLGLLHSAGNHLRRTQHYVRTLAEQLRDHPRFTEVLTPDAIRLLFKSAPMHDIGKVGIPDAILLKPGRLTPEEFEVMKTHTTLGYEAIRRAELSLGEELPFLGFCKEIALSHQEKWDGSGYPQGLAGDAIPVSARLMALADVYDALISERVYKPAMSHTDARALILKGRAQHFDPDVVDAFLSVEAQFISIAERFQERAA